MVADYNSPYRITQRKEEFWFLFQECAFLTQTIHTASPWQSPQPPTNYVWKCSKRWILQEQVPNQVHQKQTQSSSSLAGQWPSAQTAPARSPISPPAQVARVGSWTLRVTLGGRTWRALMADCGPGTDRKTHLPVESNCKREVEQKSVHFILLVSVIFIHLSITEVGILKWNI